MLARAFDRAWEQYYRRQYLTIDPEIARLELAKQLRVSLRLFLIAIVRAFIVRSALNSAPSEDNLKARS
jgi:hypothetical protein